jgi:hypothetical protein
VQSLSCSPWLMGIGIQEGNIEERVTQTGTNPTCATSLYTRNHPVYSYSAFSQWLVMRFRFFRALTDPWLAIHTIHLYLLSLYTTTLYNESAAPAATSSVTVVVKAGSRYETKPGAAHVLKSFAFKVGLLSKRNYGTGADDVVDRVGICVKDC